ncbi:hypothetical protein RB608_11960 [Nocardioides sp. LHD-245]|uniref:hypothetical protein n=1 Tax=Nocardioides sp. LHD-245 TaxID=3051387 RepID=UPI0027E144F2|nr:hypothetical protein [Nocardioides sp. LHD-245]
MATVRRTAIRPTTTVQELVDLAGVGLSDTMSVELDSQELRVTTLVSRTTVASGGQALTQVRTVPIRMEF